MGVDFSPSGEKLYITSNYVLRSTGSTGNTAFVYQFDATLPSASQIQASQVQIDAVYQSGAGAIQLGNNGKMYVNIHDDLSEIEFPENAGIACGYTSRKVRSGTGGANYNLPVFLQSYFSRPVIATGNCQFQNISFEVRNLTGVSSIFWDLAIPRLEPTIFHCLLFPPIFIVRKIITPQPLF